jgi:AcrR family transcriptional regulator
MITGKQSKEIIIVDAARELFFKHGVKRVTVEEICRKAKVSKVTFYKYYNNKQDIAKYIGDELIKLGFDRFDEINGLDLSFPEKIDLMTEWRMEFFSQVSIEFIEEIIDLESVYAEMKQRYLENIKAAQEKGEIRKGVSVELIWLVTEKLNELVKEGSWKSIFSEYSQFQQQLRRIYFYGLLEDR